MGADLRLPRCLVLPNNLRLGHQVEHIFKQLIEYSDKYNLLVYNLPIRQNKRTLGEIDFILQDNFTKEYIHIELTYKFYIIDIEIKDPVHSLVGPNRRDTFYLKKEKILNTQFPLLHAQEGIDALSKIGIDHSAVQHQCCFKAQLYTPYGKKADSLKMFNNKCHAGYWLSFDDSELRRFQDAQFYIPTKSEWIIQPHDNVSWLQYQKCLEKIAKRLDQGHAPMVWVKESAINIKKIFIVAR